MSAPQEAITFSGQVEDDGRVKPEQVNETRWRLSRWKGRKVTVKVTPYRKRRSLSQNAWYWGVIVPYVQGHLNEGRTIQLSEDQVHEVLKSAFIGQEQTPLGWAPCESKGLTTAQFSDYCEKIRAHASSEWELHIPGPNEGDWSL